MHFACGFGRLAPELDHDMHLTHMHDSWVGSCISCYIYTITELINYTREEPLLARVCAHALAHRTSYVHHGSSLALPRSGCDQFWLVLSLIGSLPVALEKASAMKKAHNAQCSKSAHFEPWEWSRGSESVHQMIPSTTRAREVMAKPMQGHPHAT